jgi:ubiquitin-activating enzyme E1
MGPYTFRIGDTSGFGDYVKGGIATQVKVPVEVHFQTLKQAIDNPSNLRENFIPISFFSTYFYP